MKWQCALLQRWLPEYPDGDLPALWRSAGSRPIWHGCPACREELAALREVVAAIEATPVADPGPEFWREFSREMHLKLVQADQDRPGCTRLGQPLVVSAALSAGGSGPGGAAALCGGASHGARRPHPGPGPAKAGG